MASRSVNTLYNIVYVTVPNMTVAKEIAREVVAKKLAACVNIVPGVTSIYEWEGKVDESSELLLVMKTKTSALSDLETAVKNSHPYDIPEFISTPIQYGSESYLKWIEEQVL